MNTSRRAFIQAGAAIPAAAIAAAVNAPLITATVAAACPYTDYAWQWFVSHDGDTYHDRFDTVEAAIEYARKCQYTVVAECKPQDFSLEVEGLEILELLDGNNEDMRGEGEGIECTQGQEDDLGKMVTAAIEAWVVKHNIAITAWTFGGVRNTIKLGETQEAPHVG